LSSVRDGLFNISAGHLLHPKIKDEPCRADRDTHNVDDDDDDDDDDDYFSPSYPKIRIHAVVFSSVRPLLCCTASHEYVLGNCS
jgi:hypothetical protein